MKHVCVLGGTGVVGRAVVRELAARGAEVSFTFQSNGELANALAAEHGARALRVDLADAEALRELLRDQEVDALIACAAIAGPTRLGEASDAELDRVLHVNVRSTLIAVRELAPKMAARGGGDIVLVGALDRAQSLPLPSAFAATQGASSALAMALAKELGASNVRVNLVALGPLEGGLSRMLDEKTRADYLALSALRRFGRPEEAAKTIAFLALENTYMSGKTWPVHGGI
jgi:NAD(P)-dependent dehydrogenase (short-subunit alcohol dehydrogenase family)